MLKEESICAIILDYNGLEKIEKCVTSLANQNIETIYILDNFATDGSCSNLLQVLNRLRLNGIEENIKILSAGKNLGFGRGVNFVLAFDGRSAQPHAYYLLLNNDAIAGPSLVSGLMTALRQNPEAALVAPRIVCDDPGRERGIWYHRYLGLLLSRPGKLRFHYFTGCCLLFSRELVTDAGLFDESFFMYGEDTDLGWRLTRKGFRMICATDVFVQHDLGPSVERSTLFYEYHMARCHLLLSLRTWIIPAEIPLMLLVKSTALLTRAITRCFRYRSLVPLAAFLMGWFKLNLHKA